MSPWECFGKRRRPSARWFLVMAVVVALVVAVVVAYDLIGGEEGGVGNPTRVRGAAPGAVEGGRPASYPQIGHQRPPDALRQGAVRREWRALHKDGNAA